MTQSNTQQNTDQKLHREFIDVKVMVQPTPNPDALKFIVNREVKAKGNVTFKTLDECTDLPLAKALLEIDIVQHVYFFENVITVTFKAGANLLEGEDKVITVIKSEMPSHDPNFNVKDDEAERRAKLSPDLKQIEEILDRTIRPALQGDGGDVEVLNYTDNELFVSYKGACGSCPSSTMGTLMAIEGILRDEFDPDIKVIPV